MAPIFRRPVNNLPAELHFPRGEEEVMNKTLAWLTAKNQGGRIAGVNRKGDPMVFKFTAGDNIYDAIDKRIAQLNQGAGAAVKPSVSTGGERGYQVISEAPHMQPVRMNTDRDRASIQSQLQAFMKERFSEEPIIQSPQLATPKQVIATPRQYREVDPIYRKRPEAGIDPIEYLDNQAMARKYNPLPKDYFDGVVDYSDSLAGFFGKQSKPFSYAEEFGEEQAEWLREAVGKDFPDTYLIRYGADRNAYDPKDTIEDFVRSRLGKDSVVRLGDYYDDLEFDDQLHIRRDVDGVDKVLSEIRYTIPFVKGGWRI